MGHVSAGGKRAGDWGQGRVSLRGYEVARALALPGQFGLVA